MQGSTHTSKTIRTSIPSSTPHSQPASAVSPPVPV